MKKAGFKILHSQKFTFIQVASHPNLKGWLLKLYLDCTKKTKDDVRHGDG